MTYNDLQQLQSVSYADGAQITMSYDILGNPTNVNSANSSFTNWYNALNSLSTNAVELKNITGFANVKYRLEYTYDAVGNVTRRVIQGQQGFANRLEATYSYDLMNRLTNVTNKVDYTTTATGAYAYDNAGRLSVKGYGNGDRTVYAYDSESRLSRLTITNGTTSLIDYSYRRDAMGKILTLTNSGAQIVYNYDAGDQLIKETLPGGVVNEWEYDTAGNTVRIPEMTDPLRYDLDDELAEITSQAPATVTVTGTVAPGVNNNKWFNTWAECRTIRAQVSQQNGTFSLPGVPLYPGANRLLVRVQDVSGNVSEQYRNVTLNRTTGQRMQYDGSGNMTSRQTSQDNWTYTWNALNQLLTVNKNGLLVLQNWYDSHGRRIAKLEVIGGTTYKWLYVYDGWNVAAVLNGANGQLVESYTRGLGLAGDVGTLVAARHHSGSWADMTIYLHANHRGDVVLARNGTSTVGMYDYVPYGTQRSITGTYNARFRFSSKELDASTGLYYYGYRFYDPNLQRWLNRDPLGEKGGNNLYAFVANNPISNIDPDGLAFEQAGFDACVEQAKNDYANCISLPCKIANQIDNYLQVRQTMFKATRVCRGPIHVRLLCMAVVYKAIIQPVVRISDKIAVGFVGGAIGWYVGCNVNYSGSVLACGVDYGLFE